MNLDALEAKLEYVVTRASKREPKFPQKWPKARIRAREGSKTLPVGVRQQQIVQMRASSGYTTQDIADALGVSKSTVDRDLQKPAVKQSLKELREAFKQAILEQSTKDVVKPAFDMARAKILAGEAKDFDAAMRGINALEKTTASASGEAQKVEVDQRVLTINRQDIYGRIEHFLREP